jgi:hypothetical protein
MSVRLSISLVAIKLQHLQNMSLIVAEGFLESSDVLNLVISFETLPISVAVHEKGILVGDRHFVQDIVGYGC